jgi:hypothetical protein
VGLATKKAHYDALWDNCDFFKIQHGTDGTHGAVTATSLASSSITPSNLTASLPVSSDGAKKLVSSTITGTGKVVMDTSPTLVTPTIGAASGTSLTLSGLTASLPVFTDGSKELVSKSVADTLTALGVGAWTDYSDISTIVGWDSFSYKYIQYKKIFNIVFVHFSIAGVSDSTTTTFTLPDSAAGITFGHAFLSGYDNGSALTAAGKISMSGTTVTCYKDCATALFTGSGTKVVRGQFFYVCA